MVKMALIVQSFFGILQSLVTFLFIAIKRDTSFKRFRKWRDYDIDISVKRKRGRDKPAECLILYNPLKDKQNVTSL